MGALLGRDEELAALRFAWTAVRAGTGQLAIVVAEGGGGKTALLQEFAATVAGVGTVLWGDCVDGEVVPPLWPWRSLLRQLEAGGSMDAAAAAQSLAQPANDAGDRFAAFERTTAALLRNEAPTAVILDDLQWADGATLQLLEFLAPQVRRARVLLLVASRPQQRPDVDAAIGTLLRRGARRIDLRGFGASEIAELASLRADDPTVASVLQRTGGNPLFVTEFARHLAAGRDIDSLPASVPELLQAELQRLSPGALAAVRACAAFDGPVKFEVVRTIAGVEAAAVDEAMARGLLRLAGDAVTFRHDVLREGARATLSATTLASMHARIADDAAERGDTALMAVHGCRAGAAWDPARAHSAALEMQRRLRAMYALESAADFALLARSVRSHLRPDPNERLQLEIEDGELFTRAGRSQLGAEVLQGAADLARAAGDARALARIALSFRLGHEYGNNIDPGVIALLEEAERLLPPGEHQLRARVLARLSWQALGSGTIELRTAYASRALAEARMSEDTVALAEALSANIWSHGRPEHWRERVELASQALAAARDAGDLDLELGALLFCCISELCVGQCDRARGYAAQFTSIVQRSPLPYHAWYASLLNGTLALADGDLERSQACAGAIDPYATTQPMMAALHAESLLAEIETARDGRVTAEATARMSNALDKLGLASVVRPIEIALRDGREAGREVLRESMRVLLGMPADEDLLAFLSCFAVAAVLVEDRESAEHVYRQLEPYADHWVVIANGASTRGPSHIFLSGLARVLGDDDAAARHRQQAEAALDQAGMRGLRHWLEVEPLPVESGRTPVPRGNGLTPREAQVLALVARGHSNREIADALVLSVRTVQRHIENVYGRLGVHNRAGAALAAVELGLLAPGDVRANRDG